MGDKKEETARQEAGDLGSSSGTDQSRKKTLIRKELLDELLSGCAKPGDLLGPGGLLKQLTGALVSRAMEAELSHHLGYEEGQAPPPEQSNRRNGLRSKTLRSDSGPIPIDVPRDREGSFEPQIVPKHQRSFDGFDDKILSMYARGMTVRDIGAHLQEIYNIEVSPDLISRVTDAVVDELRAWQSRPLESVYPVVYLDALVVKIRQKGSVQNRSVYIAVGIGVDGRKDVLGMWIHDTEGAKFWLGILAELRERGVEDILVLCADGLTGIAEAVEAAYSRTIYQTCVVHVIRSSTRFVPWKDRKAVCADLREIYTAPDAAAAELALERFEQRWGKRFPMVAQAWRRRWAEIIPFLAFPQEIRRVIYTTNVIENLNRQLRKVLKTRGHMPSDDAALKLLFLAARNATKAWKGRDRAWTTSLHQLSIHFEGRIPEC
jgi:putative transposase